MTVRRPYLWKDRPLCPRCDRQQSYPARLGRDGKPVSWLCLRCEHEFRVPR